MDIHHNEELRRVCLRYMAERAALSFNSTSVQNRISREISATIPEVEAALSFLQSSGLLDLIPNKFGGSKYYKINAAGTLTHESGF